MVFDWKKGWQNRPLDYHTMLALSVRTDASDYEKLFLPGPKLKPTNSFILSDRSKPSLISKDMSHSWAMKPEYIIQVSERNFQKLIIGGTCIGTEE